MRRHAADPRAPVAIAMPGREITYAELLRQVEACAAWLVREGCQPSELVGLTIADEVTHLVASLALLELGIPQVCLATHDPAPMRLRLAERLSVARILVADAQHRLDGIATLALMPDVLRALPYDGLPYPVGDDPDATACYFTSSGTTGVPKVIALSQSLMLRRAERLGECQSFAPDERVLMAVSVENYPAKTTRLYCLCVGVTSVLQGAPSASAPSLLDLCLSLNVTSLELTVLQALGIVQDGAGKEPLPARAKVFVGGSRVPATLRDSLRARVGPQVFVNYGAQEVWRMASTYPNDSEPGRESVGPPLPWIELEIVDGEGARLPHGEVGEVRVRSECMIHEYHGDPVATSRHFRGGWFHPGDLGSLTPGGSLCIHGRSDDMMNLNSIKIFPAEIERVLEAHPAVKAAAAFAIPSAIHGGIPAAAVELHASAQVSVEDLMARARARLGVRAPRKIVVLEALPRSAAGKIAKNDLIALVVPRK
jgi:acyl-CoA synthetase (AMP-forming)/AMP-acid ligase II